MPTKPATFNPLKGLTRSPRRPSELNDFINSRQWRRLAKWFISEHPLCAECERNGRVTAGEQIDHVVPRALRPDLALEVSNLETLCVSCHSRKTAKEKKATRGIGG